MKMWFSAGRVRGGAEADFAGGQEGGHGRGKELLTEDTGTRGTGRGEHSVGQSPSRGLCSQDSSLLQISKKLGERDWGAPEGFALLIPDPEVKYPLL